MTKYIIEKGQYFIGEYLEDKSFIVKKNGFGAVRITRGNPSSSLCPADRPNEDNESIFRIVDRATAKKNNRNL